VGADDADHNLVSIDGLGSFHGMGIIAVSTRSAGNSKMVNEKPVVRLKRVRVADAVRNKGIPLSYYCQPETPNLSTLSFRAIDAVNPPSVFGFIVELWSHFS